MIRSTTAVSGAWVALRCKLCVCMYMCTCVFLLICGWMLVDQSEYQQIMAHSKQGDFREAYFQRDYLQTRGCRSTPWDGATSWRPAVKLLTHVGIKGKERGARKERAEERAGCLGRTRGSQVEGYIQPTETPGQGARGPNALISLSALSFSCWFPMAEPTGSQQLIPCKGIQ